MHQNMYICIGSSILQLLLLEVPLHQIDLKPFENGTAHDDQIKLWNELLCKKNLD